jgi:hypothetical protein
MGCIFLISLNGSVIREAVRYSICNTLENSKRVEVLRQMELLSNLLQVVCAGPKTCSLCCVKPCLENGIVSLLCSCVL